MPATFDIHIFIVLLAVLGLILLDWIVGILQAVVKGAVQWQLLPQQLAAFVLPFFVPLLALAVVQFLSPVANIAGVTGGTTATFYAAAALAGVKAIGDILTKIGGMSTPPSAQPPGVPLG
jgi:hypothetical protein